MTKPAPTVIALRVSTELAEHLTASATERDISRNTLIAGILDAWLAGEHTQTEAKRIAEAAAQAVLRAMRGG